MFGIASSNSANGWYSIGVILELIYCAVILLYQETQGIPVIGWAGATVCTGKSIIHRLPRL